MFLFEQISERSTEIVACGKASLWKMEKTHSTILEKYYRLFSSLPGTKTKGIWRFGVCLCQLMTLSHKGNLLQLISCAVNVSSKL